MTIDEIRNEVQKKVIAEQTDVIMWLNERIAELEATVERMKCCGNCKHEPEFFSDNGCCVMCAKLDKWEAK